MRKKVLLLVWCMTSWSWGQELPETMWFLVHPTDAPDGPGMYLWDSGSDTVIQQFPLPDPTGSVHALLHDGRFLWLSDLASNGIFQIDPADGSVLGSIPFGPPTGLALGTGGFWAGRFDPLFLIDHSGNVLQQHLFGSIVSDITTDGKLLFIVSNDGEDPIQSFDPETEETVLLVNNSVNSLAPNTLSWFRGTLLIIDSFSGNSLLHYDDTKGTLLGETPVSIPGWITSSAIDPALARFPLTWADWNTDAGSLPRWFCGCTALPRNP